MTAFHRNLLVFSLVALAACSKPDDTNDSAACADPVANAGADQAALLGDSVTLDASASTVCPTLTGSYSWVFVQVPPDSALDDTAFGASDGTADAKTVSFTPDVVGSYVISMTVNDGTATSKADIVVVTVTSDNLPPIADAGDDTTGKVDELVGVDGSASRDPEGEKLEYQWTIASVPGGSKVDSSDVFNPHTATASIVPDVAGTYVLSLVVSDGIAWSDPDYVTIQVASENRAPVADAGESKTESPCADKSVELSGYGSYDPDGDALTYMWTVTSVPSGSASSDADFDDPTKPNPTFTTDIPGSYTFSLQVSDGTLYSANDIVTLTMVDPSANRSPAANAGSDQTIAAKADCTSSDYVWSCNDCDAQKFEVDGSSSSDANGDSLKYYWYDASATPVLTVASPYTAWTEVYSPPATATYGSANNTTYVLTLAVSDCEETDEDTVKLTVACTGEAP